MSAGQGAALYQKYCSACHGERGDGKGTSNQGMALPRDFTSPESAAILTRERMIRSVSAGRPGTAMVAWKGKLSGAEIEGVVDHIRREFIRAPDALAGDKRFAAWLTQGEKIYMENCSVCHGDFGKTGVWTKNSMDTAPRNFSSDFSKNVLTRTRMIESVTRGRPGTAMMPYQSRLSKPQIEMVVDYVRVVLMGYPAEQVRAEAGQGASQAVAASSADQSGFIRQPFPKGLTGNVDRGRKIFTKNCIACHGHKGDGQGPRAYFIKPRKPRNFIAEDSRRALNRPKIYTAVSNGLRGSVMPAWGKTMSEQEIADVGEFVFRAFIIGDVAGVNEADLAHLGPEAQKKN